jgi:hypothetical protein
MLPIPFFTPHWRLDHEDQTTAFRRLLLPEVLYDYELVAEAVLKCDGCGGPLVSGTIDDYFTDVEEDQRRPIGHRLV